MGGEFSKQIPVLYWFIFARLRGALFSLFAKIMRGALIMQNKAPCALYSFLFARSRGGLFPLFAHVMRGVLSVWSPLLRTCDGEGEGWPRYSPISTLRCYAVVSLDHPSHTINAARPSAAPPWPCVPGTSKAMQQPLTPPDLKYCSSTQVPQPPKSWTAREAGSS